MACLSFASRLQVEPGLDYRLELVRGRNSDLIPRIGGCVQAVADDHWGPVADADDATVIAVRQPALGRNAHCGCHAKE